MRPENMAKFFDFLLFPFDCCGGFAGDIIHNTIYAADFIDDATRN